MNKPLLSAEALSAISASERGIERMAITSREQWLALRRPDVTASAIAALLGASEYQTAYSLWALKSGLVEEEDDAPVIDEYSISLSPMGRGTLFEDLAAEMLRRLKPHWHISKCTDYYRDRASRIGATPDLLVNDPERGFGIVQIKNPEYWMFKAKWHSEGGEIEPPLDYVIQTNVEADLTSALWAAIGVFVIGHRTTLRLIPVPLHAGLMQRLRAETKEFWRRVEENDPPPPDYARNGDLINRLYPGGGAPIDLTHHNRISLLCEEHLQWARRRGSCDRAIEVIDAEIKDILGNAELAEHPDFKITRKTQKTKAYSVPAGESRVLRITRKKQTAERTTDE